MVVVVGGGRGERGCYAVEVGPKEGRLFFVVLCVQWVEEKRRAWPLLAGIFLTQIGSKSWG